MTIVARALQLLYRPSCAACDVDMPEGAALCDGCAQSLYPTGPACRRCGEPRQVDIDACPRCRESPLAFSGLVAPFRFGGELATALRRLKFADRSDIARQLAPLIAPALIEAATGMDVLVPVPLSWRRHCRRMFNQSGLLLAHARWTAGIDTPIDRRALRRRRHARPQPGLSAAARRRNVAGAFEVRRRHSHHIENRRVLLFDDVATTGATLSAAATALLAAGATEVRAMCVARAE